MQRERVPVWVLVGMGITGLASLLAVQPYSVPSPHLTPATMRPRIDTS
jgi:hypothetical protein